MDLFGVVKEKRVMEWIYNVDGDEFIMVKKL